jgi:hypothetical protein
MLSISRRCLAGRPKLKMFVEREQGLAVAYRFKRCSVLLYTYRMLEGLTESGYTRCTPTTRGGTNKPLFQQLLLNKDSVNVVNTCIGSRKHMKRCIAKPAMTGTGHSCVTACRTTPTAP